MENGLRREVKSSKDKCDSLCIVIQPTVLLLKIHPSEAAPQDGAPGDLAERDHDFAEGMNLSQVVFQGLFHLCGYDSYGKLG